MPNTADLLEKIAALKAMLITSEALNLRRDERIERLDKLVAAVKHAAFGRRLKKSDLGQFELALEDLETAIATIHAEEDADDRAAQRPTKPRAANRGSLPKPLPRIEELIERQSLTCACDGCLHCIGEDVSEYHPGPVPRDRDPPPEIRLPALHRWRGARSGAADPGRHPDRSDDRTCASQQICRPSAPCIGKPISAAVRALTSTGPLLRTGLAAPIAEKGMILIRELSTIEAEIKGADAVCRLVARQKRSALTLARLDDWLRYHRVRASTKSPLGEALAYIAGDRDGFGRFLTDGRIEIDSPPSHRHFVSIAGQWSKARSAP